MNKFKKKWLFFSLGATVAIATIPSVAIACSATNTTTSQDVSNINNINNLILNNKISVKLNNITSSANELLPTELNNQNIFNNLNGIPTNLDKNLIVKFLNRNDSNGSVEIQFSNGNNTSRKLNLNGFSTTELNQDFFIKTSSDQFVLTNKYYSGQINNIKNMFQKKGEAILNNPNPFSDTVMMGKGDALVLVFDNQDDTRKSMINFIENLYFNDTSVSDTNANEQITKNNNDIILSPNGGLGIKFNLTELSSSYYGSQTNHYAPNLSFIKNLEQIQNSFINNKQAFKNILNNYGYQEINGNFEKNPNNQNSQSNIFYPNELIPKTFWKIKQVAKNAFSFTFNGNINSLTAANISEKTSSGLVNLTGALSLGEPIEWNSYLKNGNSNILGQKINSFTNLTLNKTSSSNPTLNANQIAQNVIIQKNINDFNNGVLSNFNDIIFDNLNTKENISHFSNSSQILTTASFNFLKNFLKPNQSAIVAIINNNIYVRIKNIATTNEALDTFSNTFLNNSIANNTSNRWFFEGKNEKFGYEIQAFHNDKELVEPNFEKNKQFFQLLNNNVISNVGISALKLASRNIIEITIATSK